MRSRGRGGGSHRAHSPGRGVSSLRRACLQPRATREREQDLGRRRRPLVALPLVAVLARKPEVEDWHGRADRLLREGDLVRHEVPRAVLPPDERHLGVRRVVGRHDEHAVADLAEPAVGRPSALDALEEVARGRTEVVALDAPPLEQREALLGHRHHIGRIARRLWVPVFRVPLVPVDLLLRRRVGRGDDGGARGGGEAGIVERLRLEPRQQVRIELDAVRRASAHVGRVRDKLAEAIARVVAERPPRSWVLLDRERVRALGGAVGAGRRERVRRRAAQLVRVDVVVVELDDLV